MSRSALLLSSARAAWAAAAGPGGTSTASRRRCMSARPAPPTGGAAADPHAVDLLSGPSSSSSASPPPRVDAYDATGFEVGGVRVEGSLLIASGGLVAAWSPRVLGDVDGDVLAAPRLLGDPSPPALVILGVGGRGSAAAASPPPPAAVAALAGSGSGLEVLPTPQAAALYNVLSQEGRSVCAALLPAGEVG